MLNKEFRFIKKNLLLYFQSNGTNRSQKQLQAKTNESRRRQSYVVGGTGPMWLSASTLSRSDTLGETRQQHLRHGCNTLEVLSALEKTSFTITLVTLRHTRSPPHQQGVVLSVSHDPAPSLPTSPCRRDGQPPAAERSHPA